MNLDQITSELRKQASILNQAADVLEGKEQVVPQSQPKAPRRYISAASRKKMAEAQRRRWAVIRGGQKRAA